MISRFVMMCYVEVLWYQDWESPGGISVSKWLSPPMLGTNLKEFVCNIEKKIFFSHCFQLACAQREAIAASYYDHDYSSVIRHILHCDLFWLKEDLNF